MVELGKGVATMGKKLCTAAAGTLAASALFVGLAAGTAYADDIAPDPGAPSSNPPVEDGVRPSGYQDRSSTVGEETSSIRAVPGAGYPNQVIGGSPQPGNLSDLGIRCIFTWDNSC